MIREADIDDLAQIVSIYNEAIVAGLATIDTAPVSVESRLPWFREHTPGVYPIYVWDEGGRIEGWCSLSPYRPGRDALRFTAEISCYVAGKSRRKGIATRLARHAIAQCASLQLKNLFAIVLEPNAASRGILAKLGFAQWGFLPRVVDFDGRECGLVYYGLRLGWPDGR